MRHPVVAIDGPAASGKSTTARRVADRLGFAHLNSGLIYRAVTWIALERGWDDSTPDFETNVRGLAIELLPTPGSLRVAVDGDDPGTALHAPRVAARVSAVSSVSAVRELALTHLRGAARERGLVCDGRDIGTAVFPDAEVKVFLVAAAEERARRRLSDLREPGTQTRVEEEVLRLRARDLADSTRTLSPLRCAADAVEIDTTRLTVEEVVDRILALCRSRGIGSPEPSGDGPPQLT
jgi:cytidylate kinase